MGGIGDTKGGLHHVVTVRITQQLGERLAFGEFIDQAATRDGSRRLEALLDDVGAELLSRQAREVAVKVRDQVVLERRVRQVEHVLHDVVAERVLHKSQRVVRNLLDQLQLASPKKLAI